MRSMAEELLDRVVREIRERKRAAQAAVEESARLERALAALGRGPGETEAQVASTRSRRARRPAQRRMRVAPGANRDAILALVRERPGATAGAISQATGIPRSTVSPTLFRLTQAGAVERTELPGGGVGFRVPAAAADGATAGEPNHAAAAPVAEQTST
jgi:DNA-binding transcriptional ArsR family regulator